MKKTRVRETANVDTMITVDLPHLAEMLGCGLATARHIGEESGAKIKIGRRALYDVNCVKLHMKRLATEQKAQRDQYKQ